MTYNHKPFTAPYAHYMYACVRKPFTKKRHRSPVHDALNDNVVEVLLYMKSVNAISVKELEKKRTHIM